MDGKRLLEMSRGQLIAKIIDQEDELERLRKSNSEMSWRINPDRMGGQFTDDEINDTGWN